MGDGPARKLRTVAAVAAMVLCLPAHAGEGSGVAARPEAPHPTDPCPPSGSAVAVVTRKREIWLCVDGAPLARIPVALGQRSGDKRKKGDRRTPLGTYTLGEPRPSGTYGTFIPIDYPTREQAAQGRSGSGLGIHGPPRGKSEPHYPVTAVDWTDGCVATGTDADIERIAAFVRQRQPPVVIR